MSRAASLAKAYDVLGLEQGVSLEEVKNTYKKLALRTHPDRNPRPEATAEFQRLGEAYSVLTKHLDPSRVRSRSAFASDDLDEDCDECDDSDNEDGDFEDHLGFCFFLFDNAMYGGPFVRGYPRGSFSFGPSPFGPSSYGPPPQGYPSGLRPGQTPFRPPPKEPVETPEEQAERLRRTREKQEAAEARRQREATLRKERKEQDRQKERKAAEERQKAKIDEKKAKTNARRQQAQNAARAQREKAQKNRSAVFEAAREGNAEQVKKGVWEDDVDAVGGEVKQDHEEFVTVMPEDRQETLLHIAARNGDTELVEWLDVHNAEVEERDAQNRTAFHVAVQNGHPDIITYFFNAYSPKDPDHKQIYAPPSASVLSLSLQSQEPQVVWMVLENGLATSKDINDAWSWMNSAEGMEEMKRYSKRLSGEAGAKMDDISQLLMRFGGFTPPSTPVIGRKERPTQYRNAKSNSNSKVKLPPPPPQVKQDRASRTWRGQGSRGRS